MEDVKYFNAPIGLYKGFMKNSDNCLHNVLCIALYTHATDKLSSGSEIVRFKSACDYYGVDNKTATRDLNNAKQLSYPFNSPFVGLNVEIFWKFYSSEKSDFEKVCLLAYLAIKSILKNKPYFKLTNNYWLARMDGKSSSVSSLDELSEEIQKYSTEYQLTKIKKELRDNWGLSYYGKNVRGFYVSNSLTIEQLVLEVFKSRQKKTDNYSERIKEAEKQALIDISRPKHDH